MPNRLALCERCGREYRPDPFNRHHQKYCQEDACKAERRRALRRAWYKRRGESDAAFREAERERCRKAMRRLRSGPRVPEAAGPGLAGPLALELVVAGLVAHVTDTSDPVRLRRTLAAYADRGHRMAAGGRVRGPPTRRGFL